MEKTLQEQIALFCFSLISSLMAQKGFGRGEQEQRIREITSRSWEIPGSPRSSIGLSTVLRWIELYRRSGLDKEHRVPIDRRRFEAELVNDLWQSDCMHGPRVVEEGKLRKSFLFAAIDNHSRLITSARFCLAENLESCRDGLMRAFEKRGLPRKLYPDNGSAFRSHHLKYACARLGVALHEERLLIDIKHA